MTHNRHQLAAHEAELERCLRNIERIDTIIFLAGCAVSIIGGLCGLFFLFS